MFDFFFFFCATSAPLFGSFKVPVVKYRRPLLFAGDPFQRSPINGEICEYVGSLVVASAELPQTLPAFSAVGEGRVKRSVTLQRAGWSRWSLILREKLPREWGSRSIDLRAWRNLWSTTSINCCYAPSITAAASQLINKTYNESAWEQGRVCGERAWVQIFTLMNGESANGKSFLHFELLCDLNKN